MTEITTRRPKTIFTITVVIDLFSRKIIGWSMDNRMKARLVNDALLMAIWKRKPDKGLLRHTDRGSQYASESHRKILKEYHVIQSLLFSKRLKVVI